MPNVFVKNENKYLKAEYGETLLAVLLKNGIFVDNPCNGKGTCGKCKVKVNNMVEREGYLSSISSQEKRLVTETELTAGIRLACVVDVTEDLEVETVHKERKGVVLTSGFVPEFEKDTYDGGYGVAIDIGTTTVAADMIDMKTGLKISSASTVNPQKQYGLDVLTRITYEYENEESGIKDLQHCIVEAINAMINEMCSDAGITPNEIIEIDIAANTTMTHLLLGVDAKPMGKFPYEPVFTEAKYIKASEAGIIGGENTMLYSLPHVSAFIGSDVVAGVYVCDMQNEDKNILFIDIGTNGEIVLKSKSRLMCCSCAAGPALEGMNISSGMRAAPGAVEEVVIEKKGIELKTIGDEEPCGLCGSGILSAIKELLKNKIILKTGVFIKKDKLSEDDYRYPMIRLNGNKREFVLNEKPEIFVTQSDVRQVQLAKGAILSGFIALLNKAGIDMKDLDKVLIAGQFGAHLPMESLVGTGILPPEVKDKLIYVGNTSKTGAYMTLMSSRIKKDISSVAEKMEYVELAVTERYEEIFRDSMIFPDAW